MDIRPYLPSSQFTVTVLSLALSVGLVVAADRLTNPPQYSAGIAAGQFAPASDESWRSELLSLSSSTPPSAPGDLASLAAAAKTDNLTESVGRSLLLNLSAAQAQGMTNDESTQVSIVTQALAQVAPVTPSRTYTAADITVVGNGAAAMRAYGNAVMEALKEHDRASYGGVALAMGLAVDNKDASQAAALKAAAADYRALAMDLSHIDVPQAFVSLHVTLLNNIGTEAAACDEMSTVVVDPLRGLSGFRAYETAAGNVLGVLIAVQSAFERDGILFSESEAGHGWNLLKQY